MSISIEKARFGDLNWPAIREIRDLVFIQEQAVSEEEEYDEFESESVHFLASMEGKAAGTARWRRSGYGFKLERFAVRKEFRGFGAGRALVNCVLEDVLRETSGQEMIYLHAQVQVIPFYSSLGFEAVGDEFTEAGIRHRKMVFTGKGRD